MAEHKTEEPTEHRVAQARLRGVVAISRELQSGLTAFGLCVVLVLGGRTWFAGLLVHLRSSLVQACAPGALAGAGRSSLQALVEGLEIPMAIALAAAMLGGAVQTRGLFSSYALRFEFGRILPSLRPMRGPSVWIAIGRMLVNLTLVAALVWWTMRPALGSLSLLAGASAGRILSVLSTLAGDLGLRLGLAAIGIGLVDYFWQRHQYRQSLRMTREEVRCEQKEREGDPKLKAARDRTRLEILQQHAMDEVREANLVVVDREGMAVALFYNPVKSPAPLVLCKGERLTASRIVKIACESRIPICNDEALAAVLVRVEEGNEIPEATHEAVARLLVSACKVPR